MFEMTMPSTNKAIPTERFAIAVVIAPQSATIPIQTEVIS